jgi:ribosome biogenesis GTPase
LWTSGVGIERAFRDVFDVADNCRFRDCKHLDEPDCAVLAAIEEGTLPVARLMSMRQLVAEELSVEEEQIERERAEDRRGFRRKKPQ